MLQVNNLTSGYKNKIVIKDISFEIGQGDIVAIVGANGSGKSTLLKTIAGLIKPFKGFVVVDEENVHCLSLSKRAQQIAFLPQERHLPEDLSVYDYLLLGRIPYTSLTSAVTQKDHDAVNRVIDILNLVGFENSFCKNLSGGEQQRIQFARVLVQETPLILLDEPVNSLDIKYQWEIIKIIKQIKELNKTFLIVIHDLFLVKCFCNKVILLKDGTLYSSGGVEVLNKNNLKEVYNITDESFFKEYLSFISDK